MNFIYYSNIGKFNDICYNMVSIRVVKKMFDFKNANENQKEAISTVEGPVLITAGPGTGKTFTLVNRAIYMIQEKGVNPESIMIATFTEKAAKEIITRISNELIERGIKLNVKDMYIGTFHSICLRILKENIEYTDLKSNYILLDSFDQQYLVYQNLWKFRNIDNYILVGGEKSLWHQAEILCRYINNLEEELIDISQLEKSDDVAIVAYSQIAQLYRSIIKEQNMLDFSTIQSYTLKLLNEYPDILQEYKQKINYIMVDEYQDTNYVQEQLVFKLGSEHQNICVVGDDDQGLYRFRGATIRNILEFPQKFPSNECKIVPLTMNYRSDSKIINFYNKWMMTTEGRKFKFSWDEYRYDKRIKAPINSSKISPTVLKISGNDSLDDWFESILRYINDLKQENKIKNLNQIAFLFNSVKHERVQKLAEFLENNNIGVYAPRSNMYFDRNEIKLTLGIFLLLFPTFIQKLDSGSIPWMQEEVSDYYRKCIEHAVMFIKQKDNSKLLKWIQKKGLEHSHLNKNTDYAFSGILYHLFEFEPYNSILGIELNTGLSDQRESRNLSIFSSLLSKFEYAHRITVFTSNNIDDHLNRFFNGFLKFLLMGGIGEYEDDSEYAPSGCVSFLTIHQSKGMEFPIVIVDSLSSNPRNRNNGLIDIVNNIYQQRPPFEPIDKIKFFDFWRLYYTAFSRAQDMLVLTCNVKTGRSASPSKYFKDIYDTLPEYNRKNVNLNEFEFHEIKNVNIKEKYSFTSDIAVYNNCSLQYKFFKELGFTPIRVGSTIFGMLVHQTIEDIHNCALKGEISKINKPNIKNWFDDNYRNIVNSEHSYLAEAQLNTALKQVYSYVERQTDKWDQIQEAEYEVSLVKEKYILEGKIDLIKGEGDTVEIVDFKSEKKPDLISERDKLDYYKKQLHVYAHLVEEKLGKTVSKLNLYYTSAINENPIISFSKNSNSINHTIKEFDEIVEKIECKNYKHKSKNQILCSNCDFRYYCKV